MFGLDDPNMRGSTSRWGEGITRVGRSGGGVRGLDDPGRRQMLGSSTF